jgi:hypothetical protein
MKHTASSSTKPLLSEQEFLRRLLGNLRTRDPDKVAQAELAIQHRLQQTRNA